MVQLEETVRQQQALSAVPNTTSRSDQALVLAVQEGDREAAEELVRNSYEQVFASLVRLCGDRDQAADLTQDTYRSAWSSISSFRGGARFSTWLYRIAYNTFLNQRRRPALMMPLDDQQQVVDPAPGLEVMFARTELDEQLRSFVVDLPDELRLVVTARYWGEVSTEEIARLEKITRSAVRKRLSKAKRMLRRRFDQGDAS